MLQAAEDLQDMTLVIMQLMVVLAEVLQDKMDYQTAFIMALAENKLLLVQEDHQRNLIGIPSKLNSDVEHQPVILQM